MKQKQRQSHDNSLNTYDFSKSFHVSVEKLKRGMPVIARDGFIFVIDSIINHNNKYFTLQFISFDGMSECKFAHGVTVKTFKKLTN